MSPTRTAPAAIAVMSMAMAVGFGGAALALGVRTSPQAQARAALGPPAGIAAYAYSDEAIPGEGRPPTPGPTDPDGAPFR
jgi:hypothetical protein